MKESCEAVLTKKTRVFYFDVLRAIACLSVIMYHTSGNYVASIADNMNTFGNINYWIAYFFDAMSRIGVPLFVMISGALMLDLNYSFTKKKLKQHVWKIGIFYFFWIAVYAAIFKVFLPILHHEAFSVKTVLSVVNNEAYHLWFLPMILGLYLVTPLLKLWVNEKNKKYVEYFLILSFAFNFVVLRLFRLINLITPLPGVLEVLSEIDLSYLSGYVFYFVLGWYLHNFALKKQKTIVVACGLLGFFMTYLGSFVLSQLSGNLFLRHSNFNPNISLFAIALFLLAKRFFGQDIVEKKPIFAKCISSVSRYSFGIYGVHQICIYGGTLIIYKAGITNVFLNLFVIFFVAFVGSYLVSYLFSKIPLLKRVV